MINNTICSYEPMMGGGHVEPHKMKIPSGNGTKSISRPFPLSLLPSELEVRVYG